MNLQDMFIYDENSPSFLIHKINRPPKAFAGEFAGWLRKDGYWLVGYDGVDKLVHRVIYEMHYGKIPKEFQVDHKDGSRGNNSISNLRLVPSKVNQRNMSLDKRNKSGTAGVTLISVPSGKNIFYYWTATWKDLKGKRRSKHFSISKLGNNEAFKLAYEHRQSMIEELNAHGAGYTERHGK